MKNEFLNCKLSLKLKKLGFNQPCFGYYTGDISHLVLKPSISILNSNDDNVVCAILFQQAFDWFRTKYKLNASVYKWQPDFSRSINQLIKMVKNEK